MKILLSFASEILVSFTVGEVIESEFYHHQQFQQEQTQLLTNLLPNTTLDNRIFLTESSKVLASDSATTSGGKFHSMRILHLALTFSVLWISQILTFEYFKVFKYENQCR